MQMTANYEKQRALIAFVLLAGSGAALLFLGRWSRRAEKWNWTANLPENFSVETVTIGDGGVGVIGGYFEDRSQEKTLEERMRGRTAVVWRVEGKSLEKVYEGMGRVSSLDCFGSNWFGVASTLKVGGSGSDYRLIRSLDQAKSWQDAGVIPAISIVQILAKSSSVIVVFGANTLLATEDGGKNWTRLPMPRAAESREFTQSIALAQDGGLLAFGTGLMRLSSGATTWEWILPDTYTVEAVSDPFVASVIAQEVQLLRRTQQGISKVSNLPADRLPVRIAAEGRTIRILTHPRDPEKLGFFEKGLNRTVLRSLDDGKSWTSQGLRSIQQADLRGAYAGLGIDIINNGIYSAP